MKQGIYEVDVAESASRLSRTSGDADSSGHPRKIFVDLSSRDFTSYRSKAYAFDLRCLDFLKRCKTDEFLPTVNDLKDAIPSADEFEHATLSSIAVHEFAADDSIGEILPRLAVRYHVVIGCYGKLAAGDRNKIELSIKNGTLPDAFNAIVQADPGFEWHEGRNGVAHFVTRNANFPWMDLVVPSFDADAPESDDIFRVPVVQRWFEERKCPAGSSILHTGGEVEPWRNYSVHLRDVKVSSVLDEIAARSRLYYWSAIEVGPSPCAIETVWQSQ